MCRPRAETISLSVHANNGDRVMDSEREARGLGSVEVLPMSAVGETASSVLGSEEGRVLLVRRVSIVFCGPSVSSRWTLGSWQQNSI